MVRPKKHTMEEEMVAGETLEAQEEVETPETPQESVDLEALKKQAELAENYKIRAEKAERALKAKPPVRTDVPDSLELIKLGKKLQDYSDEELDFVTNFAKSKNPSEVLQALDNEMVQMAISAKREKVEKEKQSLKPSATQPISNPEYSMEESLENAGMEDKEKILREAGLYSEPSRGTGKVLNIRMN